MRQDQFERMQELSERLIDVAMDEADPDKWPGAGWAADQLTKDQRGDRYWSKKNAVATLSLIDRIHHIVNYVRSASAGGGADPAAVTEAESELDAEINAAEKEATKLLDRVQRETKRSEFKKHVIGKP